MEHNQYRINTVDILDEGEQIAFVLTPIGGFIVGSIPDARTTDARDAGILAKADSLDAARIRYARLKSAVSTLPLRKQGRYP